MAIKINGHHLETEEILEGFLYSYRQLDTNAAKVYEASADLYSLIELLVAKGVIGAEELDERKKTVKKHLQDSFKEAGIGVRVQRSEVDKYSLQEEPTIDCNQKLPICRSACCRLAYPLSVQDINEGVRWSLGKPFMNARGPDGYCMHLQRDTLKCSIYEHRPSVCRQYDCHNDRRVWLDFDKMIIDPNPFEKADPPPTEETSDE
ncbi:YkgJ family cysteine cluster protein [Chloroflexota bacterium]